MTARDDILGRVRGALADAPEPPTTGAVGPLPGPPADLIALFEERVADYRAIVERCTTDEVQARVHAALPDGSRVVVPRGLRLEISEAVVDEGLASTELAAFDAVVTRARLGIAETGTIVLDHDDSQGRRAISLVPDRHVCIVEAGQIVADVPDAVAMLDTARPLTWISGPSATSDIELTRVEGVHGPRTLHVILVVPGDAGER